MKLLLTFIKTKSQKSSYKCRKASNSDVYWRAGYTSFGWGSVSSFSPVLCIMAGTSISLSPGGMVQSTKPDTRGAFHRYLSQMITEGQFLQRCSYSLRSLMVLEYEITFFTPANSDNSKLPFQQLTLPWTLPWTRWAFNKLEFQPPFIRKAEMRSVRFGILMKLAELAWPWLLSCTGAQRSAQPFSSGLSCFSPRRSRGPGIRGRGRFTYPP